MIRNELKKDPIGFVSKNLGGVILNKIEQLYLVNKCPNLFKYILDPSILAQRLYIFREHASNLSISNIREKSLMKKALRKNYMLCIYLDIVEYEREISWCVDYAHRNRDIYILERLLENRQIPNCIFRKILLLEPRLLKVAVKNPNIEITEDIEMFVFKTNPLLIENLDSVSSWTLINIVRMGIENLVYITKWIDEIEKEILVFEICDHIMKYKTDCKYSIIVNTIHIRPEIFTDVIKTLYKNGLSMNTHMVIRILLKEFNDLVDDEIAQIVINSDE